MAGKLASGMVFPPKGGAIRKGGGERWGVKGARSRPASNMPCPRCPQQGPKRFAHFASDQARVATVPPLTSTSRFRSGGMRVITCPKCAKDNQDHYKFCLGCGAELPRDAAPKPFIPQTPPQAMRPGAQPGPGGALGQARSSVAAPPVKAAPLPVPSLTGRAPPMVAAAAPAVSGATAASSGTVLCPQCGHVNTPANLFCGSCGFRLGVGVKSFAPAAAPADVSGGGGVVLTALRADGSEAGTYRLPPGTV